MGFAPLERMPTSTKVLVADLPEMDEKLRECLPGHELTFVRTMVEALKALRHDGFQLVVIGLYFDEPRMLELLQYVRSLPAFREVPCVCVPGDLLNLSEALLNKIDVAEMRL